MTASLLAQTEIVRGDTSVELVLGVLLFLVVGVAVPFVILLAGRFLRPTLPNVEKGLPYECGEPPIGDSWVQFDLRFYIVALFFIIFDVEIALLWPWAVVFGQGDESVKTIAMYDMLFFFGVLVVGFLYLWKYGYLDWVRATGGRRETRIEAGASE